METKEAIFGGGCFWGTEYYMKKLVGVISAESGYSGGNIENPSYEEVCSGTTGHAEVILVTYNPELTNYETLLRFFMEIHDPTTLNRQGVDNGNQYRSIVFYENEEEKDVAESVIAILYNKGFDVVTEVSPKTTFYKAEKYHQEHYENKGILPSCHSYVKRF